MAAIGVVTITPIPLSGQLLMRGIAKARGATGNATESPRRRPLRLLPYQITLAGNVSRNTVRGLVASRRHNGMASGPQKPAGALKENGRRSGTSADLWGGLLQPPEAADTDTAKGYATDSRTARLPICNAGSNMGMVVPINSAISRLFTE